MSQPRSRSKGRTIGFVDEIVRTRRASLALVDVTRRSSLALVDDKLKRVRKMSFLGSSNEELGKNDHALSRNRSPESVTKSTTKQGAEKVVPCGLDADSYKKLKESTGLSDEELESRYQEFKSNFPDGVITYNEFRDLSSQVLDPSEVEAFCRNVFRMFDSNKDANLTFDEFTIATTAKDSSPAEKLAWLFDHVYDKNQTGRISRDELSEIMGTLLAMENFSPPKSDELINDIFRDLDLNQDGHISKREFLIATTQSSMLSKILGNAATEERKKKADKMKTEHTKTVSHSTKDETNIQKKKKHVKSKQPVKYDPTQRRPSREMDIYGLGVKSLLAQAQMETNGRR